MLLTPSHITIRPEQLSDSTAVTSLLKEVFCQPDEAELVTALHRQKAVTLSFIALFSEQVVGHILFSDVTIANNPRDLKAIGLAPLAVLPAYQKQGIGSQLVRNGLIACRDAGYAIVSALGYPGYYTRFGFRPARYEGLFCTYVDQDNDAFMVLELDPGTLIMASGLVTFHPAFDAM
jgi:putative acetyltransferase